MKRQSNRPRIPFGIRFKTSSDESGWKTLPELREELQKRNPGKWTHSRIFEDVDVAFEEGTTPTAFWDQWSERDQAFALARSRAKGTMKAWEEHLQEREMARQRKKK
jgi:hypothetical protein